VEKPYKQIVQGFAWIGQKNCLNNIYALSSLENVMSPDNKKMPWWKIVITVVLSIAILGLPFCFGNNIYLKMFAYICIVTLLVILFIDRISEVSLGQLTLKLREKINEAEQLTERLKNFARIWAKITIDAAILRESCFTDGSEKTLPLKSFLENIQTTLKEMGLPEEEISNIVLPLKDKVLS